MSHDVIPIDYCCSRLRSLQIFPVFFLNRSFDCVTLFFVSLSIILYSFVPFRSSSPFLNNTSTKFSMRQRPSSFVNAPPICNVSSLTNFSPRYAQQILDNAERFRADWLTRRRLAFLVNFTGSADPRIHSRRRQGVQNHFSDTKSFCYRIPVITIYAMYTHMLLLYRRACLKPAGQSGRPPGASIISNYSTKIHFGNPAKHEPRRYTRTGLPWEQSWQYVAQLARAPLECIASLTASCLCIPLPLLP